MLLLKYDTKSIRVFVVNKEFIEFSHLENNLLPIAPILFSSSADLVVTPSILQKCNRLVFAQRSPSVVITITFNHCLTITIDNKIFTMTRLRAEYWQKIFKEDSDRFVIMESQNRIAPFQKRLLAFFEEMGIEFSPYMRIYEIFYDEEYFFIPMEFLSETMLIKHRICGGTHIDNNISTISMVYDPDLEPAYKESLKTLELMKLKQLTWGKQNPNTLFVSAHGTTDGTSSHLENQELESIIQAYQADFVIFNSCVLAQKIDGIINDFLKKGSVVIASPFYTLANKTIFAPLLRFLHQDFFLTFIVAGIFTPKISRFFRYIEPFE